MTYVYPSHAERHVHHETKTQCIKETQSVTVLRVTSLDLALNECWSPRQWLIHEGRPDLVSLKIHWVFVGLHPRHYVWVPGKSLGNLDR